MPCGYVGSVMSSPNGMCFQTYVDCQNFVATVVQVPCGNSQCVAGAPCPMAAGATSVCMGAMDSALPTPNQCGPDAGPMYTPNSADFATVPFPPKPCIVVPR